MDVLLTCCKIQVNVFPSNFVLEIPLYAMYRKFTVQFDANPVHPRREITVQIRTPLCLYSVSEYNGGSDESNNVMQ